jgi:glycosyltransferase involved in cell wall biosynthesis
MRGCLEDLERQTIAKELEIIVIDSASPQNEGAIVKEFQERYGNIVYIRTEERETMYGAWNRGIRAARGQYVTSANTDDRHRVDALEIMARALDENPDVTLVYADCAVTRTENDTFEAAHPVGRFEWPDFSLSRLLEDCLVGPQPLWRREVHEEHGYFDDRMVSAGDYEFWLRIARNRRFLHLRQCLGLYLESQTGVERRSAEFGRKEAEEARARYSQDILAAARNAKGVKRSLLRLFWRGE